MEELDSKTEAMEKSETKNNKRTEVSVEETAVEKVGDMIRNARIKKKVDISEVSEDLRIRRVFLEAIETSNYNVLPGFPYNVGFIRSYADYLGLSGSRMADLYRTELDIKDGNNKGFSQENIETESSIPCKKCIIISVIAASLLYFAWFAFNKYNSEYANVEALETVGEVSEDFALQIEDLSSEIVENGGVIEIIDLTDTEEAEVEGDQITVEDGVYLVDDAENTSVSEDVQAKGVEVKMIKRIWFEAKDDKKLYVSKIFEEGSAYKIPKKPGMIISVGDPDAVEVYVDGGLVADVFTRRKKTNVNLDSFIDKARH
ncbi:MAG: helix-turn-helix domain-containing protein [Lactobacillaceae bacterium]|nr:helix-turn-helix domain-containing protein [Lactobacillaceae bacterium]